jgi:hypothetical protein
MDVTWGDLNGDDNDDDDDDDRCMQLETEATANWVF